MEQKLTFTEWANQYEHNVWSNEQAPYQIEILNSITGQDHNKVVIMAGSQVGKTEILLNAIGYHFDEEQETPMLMMLPTSSMLFEFSKERLSPMLKNLSKLENNPENYKRDTFISLVEAHEKTTLSSLPIRILLVDEVDRFPISGLENLLTTAEKRTKFYCNNKIIITSTPTIKRSSKIESEFNVSTKEKYHVPCPSCGGYQPLVWSQMEFLNASHLCKHCGRSHTKEEWNLLEGKWVAENPNSKIRGFHITGLLSPWKKWEDVIEEFMKAKQDGNEAMKIWVNSTLGETWEEEKMEQTESKKTLKIRVEEITNQYLDLLENNIANPSQINANGIQVINDSIRTMHHLIKMDELTKNTV